MITTMRKILPGQTFQLCRTLDRYAMIRRDIAPGGKVSIIVLQQGADKETTLHHACHVWLEVVQ